MKFTPACNLSKFKTYISLQKFVRTLNIKKYFLSKPGERSVLTGSTVPSGIHSNLANKSVFNPPKNDHKHVEVFKNMVISDLEKMKVRKVGDPAYLKKGIRALEKNKNVVIRPADKGGGLVIMSKSYYQEEMDRLLSDRKTYQVLTKDPISQFKDKLEVLISLGKTRGVLNKKVSYLNPSACRIIFFTQDS